MVKGRERKVLAVVPARFASTRFPGKIIALLDDKPLVYHAYQQTRKAALVDLVLIATDHKAVVDALTPYDVPVVMTSENHPSGTDRIAEVAHQYTDFEVIVNVQGDEPLVDPRTIDRTIESLLQDEQVVMSTARHRITDPERIADPNVVKVICNRHGHALYFSRSPIPYVRDEAGVPEMSTCHWQHLGLYAYRREFLLQYAQMAQTPLEQLEKLEQLRVLENGYTIAVVDTEYEAIGVDVPEDLERVRDLMMSLTKER